MADHRDQVAIRLTGHLFADLVALVLEVEEPNLHQLVLGQLAIEASEKRRRNTPTPKADGGFEALGLTLELADEGIGKRLGRGGLGRHVQSV